ncbi:hypothetical protein FA13DRAFT_1737744 [Coprinellus micaceus]|uniref:Uncharacterized protein n=1 Tax=Coprinellus micaceus TaxID=71717 RepID=A0A4Y7SW59_COPMI|nr:hypothetical protein FA13DRAFT_1737744 [Coprinellus micaceus]
MPSGYGLDVGLFGSSSSSTLSYVRVIIAVFATLPSSSSLLFSLSSSSFLAFLLPSLPPFLSSYHPPAVIGHPQSTHVRHIIVSAGRSLSRDNHHGIVKQPGVGEQTVSHVVVLPWRGAWVGARRPPALVVV